MGGEKPELELCALDAMLLAVVECGYGNPAVWLMKLNLFCIKRCRSLPFSSPDGVYDKYEVTHTFMRCLLIQ